MTQDKELLLKDLCARLPYDVQVRRYVYTTPTDAIESVELFDPEWLKELYSEEAEFKPYLFPLSSMTEEQKKEMSSFDPFQTEETKTLGQWAVHLVDFYNKYHFDYHGLIEKGLAIDATEKRVYEFKLIEE